MSTGTAAARSLLAASLLLLARAGSPAQEAAQAPPADAPRGSLADISQRRRVALLVTRTRTVDARGPTVVAVESYRQAVEGAVPPAHPAGHHAAARRLNKYIRKYRSMSAVRTYAQADFVLVFNVLRVRSSFIPDEPYIFGKLYVIARGSAADPRPRIVWESKGHESRVDSAVGDFLKALKAARGEK
jgi:hypothetical protein